MGARLIDVIPGHIGNHRDHRIERVVRSAEVVRVAECPVAIQNFPERFGARDELIARRDELRDEGHDALLVWVFGADEVHRHV